MTGRPAAHGARALVGDVQRFGLFSAAAVVDRYVEIVNRAIAADAVISRPPLAERDATRADLAARVAAACLELLDAVTSVLVQAGPAWTAPDQEGLTLPRTSAGSGSEVSVWVHNPTAAPVTSVELRATSLAGSRSSIPVEAVSFTPSSVPVVEPGAARAVRLHVAVPAGQPPGCYHGLVVSSVDGSQPIPMSLEVRAPGDGQR